MIFVELVLLVVAWFLSRFGVTAWDQGDRMSACGFWTAAGLSLFLGLGMFFDRGNREREP